jgi:EAL domain-containing protein (putative c-di-GMP-specific phosphodiesterase class I)
MRAALGAAALVLTLMPTAVATAQPTGDAEQTISRLESEGYDVIVDRVGTGDLSQCKVTGVRHPQTLTQTIVTGHDHNRDVVTVVVSKSIHVTLDCGG